MEAFYGKWKQIDLPINGNAFLSAAGINEDVYKIYMQAFRPQLNFEKHGKGFKKTIIIGDPPITKVYEIKVGEPYVTTDIFGRKFRGLTTIESPTKIKDVCTDWADSEVTTTREITGDILTTICTTKGVSSQVALKRIQ